MQAFYWTSYGNTDVYLAETSPQLMSIYEDIKSNLDGWVEDTEIEKFDKFILDNNKSEKSIRMIISAILDEVKDSHHEPFESLGFVEIKG